MCCSRRGGASECAELDDEGSECAELDDEGSEGAVVDEEEEVNVLKGLQCQRSCLFEITLPPALVVKLFR